MARAYRRDQAGAPALEYSTSGNSVVHFTALKTILKACLVSGYGVYPAAGWELVNEGANYLVLRNGSHTGYVCLTWVSGVVRVYLAATYTGMSGDVMTGDGLKSGVASGNTLPQAFSASNLAYSSANTSWALVADEKTFVLSLIGYSINNSLNSGTASSAGLTLYVGEDTSAHFMAVGGTASASTSPIALKGLFSGDAGGITSVVDPATGLLVSNAALSVATPGCIAELPSAQSRATVLPLGSVDLARYHWCGGGVYAGALRGIAVAPQLMDMTFPSIAAQSLGYPAVMDMRGGSSPIDLGDGYTYFVRMANSYAPMFLLTDNPGMW